MVKPVVDMLHLLPVETVSFLSDCTVLAMSFSSLIRTRKDGILLNVRTSTPLAVGAVFGGLLGKWLFERVRTGFANPNVLGAVQSVCLTVITILYNVFRFTVLL